MRRILGSFAALTLFTAVGAPAVASSCSDAKAASVATADIVDTAVQAGSFKTLVAAVQAAGLVDALKGSGPLTVFAPTDEAFAKLPAGTVESLLRPENKDQLRAILTYHVVAGAIYSKDAKPGQVETLQGSDLSVTKQGQFLMIDQARVVTADIATSNGVIHVIDQVILPESLRSAAGAKADAVASVRSR